MKSVRAIVFVTSHYTYTNSCKDYEKWWLGISTDKTDYLIIVRADVKD